MLGLNAKISVHVEDDVMEDMKIEDVERYVDELKGQGVSTLAKQYSHLKRVYEELEATRKRFGKQIEFLKVNVLPRVFEEEGITSFTTDEGYRVTISHRVFATMTDKIRAYEWLRENRMGDLVVETVNASTLSALAKNVMDGGLQDEGVYDLPEEIFKVEIRPQVSVTKTK